MKRLWWGKGFIALIIVLGTCSVGVNKLCQAIFSITNAHWYFDERFSDAGQKAIIRFGDSCCNNNFSSFTEQMQKRFPIIKDITLSHDSSGTMNIKIESIVPKARIDDQSVVSEDGIVVKAYFFRQGLVDALPGASTHQVEQAQEKPVCIDCQDGCCELDPLFTSWITKTSTELLTTYHVTWIDQFHVRLQDKEQQLFFLQIAAETELNKHILAMAQKIKSSLIDRGCFLRTTNHWIADLRFRDHVIIFREQRGMKHGTGTS